MRFTSLDCSLILQRLQASLSKSFCVYRVATNVQPRYPDTNDRHVAFESNELLMNSIALFTHGPMSCRESVVDSWSLIPVPATRKLRLRHHLAVEANGYTHENEHHARVCP